MKKSDALERLILGFLCLSVLCFVLTLGRVAIIGSVRYVFLLWNLILAWLPLLFAWQIGKQKRKRYAWTFAALCVAFLPNSFYLITDFIHLQNRGDLQIIYDVVLLFVFSLHAVILGLSALRVLHKFFKKTFSNNTSWWLMGAVILGCSLAIYLGRYLRWNSWDLFLNPLGLVFDVSDRLISPSSHPQTFVTTGLFFALISSLYLIMTLAIDYIKLEDSKT